MTWRTSKRVSRQGVAVGLVGGGGWRVGGHKDSFVSVLASALAAVIEGKKKSFGGDGRWCGGSEWAGVVFERCLCLSLQATAI